MPGFSWPELHGGLTHFPIALLITACVFEIGGILLRRPEGRLIGFWLLVAAVVMAVPALFTGWMTGGHMFGQTPSPPSVFVWHRAMAFTTAGIALLLLVWRGLARDRLPHTAHLGSILILILAAGVVGYTGFLGGEMVFGAKGAAPVNQNSDSAQAGRNGSAGHAQPSAQEIQAGQQLFLSKNCRNCHTVNGSGGNTAPDLTHEGQFHSNIDWQIAHLKNPGQISPGSFMPSYASLSPNQLHALAAFLVTRK